MGLLRPAGWVPVGAIVAGKFICLAGRTNNPGRGSLHRPVFPRLAGTLLAKWLFGFRIAGQSAWLLPIPMGVTGMCSYVVYSQPELQEAGGEQRQHQRRVAEDRPARESRQDGGDEARRRQEDDVDLRMAEEPEQVLLQQGVAVLRDGSVRRSKNASRNDFLLRMSRFSINGNGGTRCTVGADHFVVIQKKGREA